MRWERGQCGFCPLPFLATSLHTDLSAWATPRALMFLSRRSAHSGSCPPGKLQGHLNSFQALDNQLAATKTKNGKNYLPRLFRTFQILPRAMLLSTGAAEAFTPGHRPTEENSCNMAARVSFHLSWRWDSSSYKPFLQCQLYCTEVATTS